MNSILQSDTSHCYICGMSAGLEPLDKHHIFGGACRQKSEEYGLFVYLHHCKCHIFGSKSVHQNSAYDRKLKSIAQKAAMDKYGLSVNDFIKIFGHNFWRNENELH